MASADRLIFACKEDTAVLTSLRAWFEEELDDLKEKCIKAPDLDDVLRLQGAAAHLRRMREKFTQQVKTK